MFIKNPCWDLHELRLYPHVNNGTNFISTITHLYIFYHEMYKKIVNNLLVLGLSIILVNPNRALPGTYKYQHRFSLQRFVGSYQFTLIISARSMFSSGRFSAQMMLIMTVMI